MTETSVYARCLTFFCAKKERPNFIELILWQIFQNHSSSWTSFSGLWARFAINIPKYIYTEQLSRRAPSGRAYRRRPTAEHQPDNGETLCIACICCAAAFARQTRFVVGSERNEQTPAKT